MAKSTPQISVIERRLQGPGIFRTSAQPIPLVEPKKWTLRWCYTKVATDHLWTMVNTKGWEYASPDDLACSIDEISATLRDGRIVRGERGEEVLLKMGLRDYRKLEKAKSEETIKQTFGKKQLQNTIVAQTAAEHGDRAAEYVSKNVNAITVQDARGPEGE